MSLHSPHSDSPPSAHLSPATGDLVPQEAAPPAPGGKRKGNRGKRKGKARPAAAQDEAADEAVTLKMPRGTLKGEAADCAVADGATAGATTETTRPDPQRETQRHGGHGEVGATTETRPDPQALILDLESRQEELLRQLDDLNRRVETALVEFLRFGREAKPDETRRAA